MGFSDEEKRNIYEIYVKSRYNMHEAQREYARLYPGRILPSLKTFRRVYDKVTESNTFNRKKRTHNRDEILDQQILLSFQGNEAS